MVATIKAKFKSSVEELAKVLQCLDTQQSGALTLRCLQHAISASHPHTGRLVQQMQSGSCL